MTILQLHQISKSFKNEDAINTILDNISLTIEPKEIISIIGSSGSGKTTLLNIMMGLESIDSGKIQQSQKLKATYVTQHAHFIDELSIEQNLQLVTLTSPQPLDIQQYLSYFQCEHLLYKKPRNLSGGEKQRVNIVRGLLTQPNLLILDEPTASLDYDNKIKACTFINNVYEKENFAMVLVTHDKDILKEIHQHKIYELKNKHLHLL